MSVVRGRVHEGAEGLVEAREHAQAHDGGVGGAVEAGARLQEDDAAREAADLAGDVDALRDPVGRGAVVDGGLVQAWSRDERDLAAAWGEHLARREGGSV